MAKSLDGKTITENAERLLAERGISTKEKFLDALETMDQLLAKVAKLTVAITAYRELYKRLSEGCSDYAEDHSSVFSSETFAPDRDGIESGVVESDGKLWRYTKSLKGYKRISGSNMTTSFLEKLGEKLEGSVKTKLELNITGLNSLDLTASDLAAHDLVRNTERKWSRVAK